MPRPSRSPLLIVLCLGCVRWAVAGVSFSTASFNFHDRLITINVTASQTDFTAAIPQLEDRRNWAIYYRKSRYAVQAASVNITQAVVRLQYDTQSLVTPYPADLKEGDLTVEYRPPGQVPTPVENSVFLPQTQGLKFTASKKDADIDISGGFQAGVGAKPEYFWSVKAAYPFSLKNGYGHIDPTFTGEASQQKNADPDSLKASIVYNNRWPSGIRSGFAFSADLLAYEFERSVASEAVLVNGTAIDRNLLQKDSNLVWSGNARYVNGWRTLNYSLGFAGFEVGKVITRTVKTDSRNQEITQVARPKFDADVYHDFFKGKGDTAKRLVTFDGHYTLRLPLTEEPFLQANRNGGNPFLTRKPRHWVALNTVFLVKDGVGFTVQYKYGSLPPSFEFVDSQVTVGLSLLIRRK